MLFPFLGFYQKKRKKKKKRKELTRLKTWKDSLGKN